MPVELSASQALNLWAQRLAGTGADRQSRPDAQADSILLHIYLVPPPHTRAWACRNSGCDQPVITRALDTMGDLGLVTRSRDERDKRNVIIKRTVEGALYLEKLGDLIIDQGRKLSI